MAEREDELREDELRAERFERYLDALLTDGRPSPDDVADPNEAEMARLAAELSAATGPDEPGSTGPDAAFVDQLRLVMRQADQGVANVQVPLPVRRDAQVAEPSGRRWRMRLTRRELMGAALGAAAGLAAGAAGLTVFLREVPETDGWTDADLVAGEGLWVPVAAVAELSEGEVLPFSTRAFDGFLVNDAGEVRALSASCTHLGCQLQFRPAWRDFRCPCHSASFNLRGWLANGREQWREQGPYRGDLLPYPVDLPPLARPKVKVSNETIFVWTAKL
jgi:nitrite reductase/ring-hydroxylating ferredoxin subunit